MQLAAGWSKGKDLYAEGVHLVTVKDSVDTLVNFYVYPPKSRNTAAELNDYFFGELSPRLKSQGTLTSDEPAAGELFGRPAITRNFSFTMPGSRSNFDLHTLRLDLGDRVLLVLIQVQDRDRTRVLREVGPMLASVKGRSTAANPPETGKRD